MASRAWVQTSATVLIATWPLPRCAASAHRTSANRRSSCSLKWWANRRSRQTPWCGSRTSCSPVSNTRSKAPARWPVTSCPGACMATILMVTQAKARPKAFRRSPSSISRRSMPGPTLGNAVIALVGDLSRADAEAIAAQVSAALPKGPSLPKTVEPTEPKPGETHIEFASKHTHLLLAQLGIERDDPDYAALMLGNSILGGGGFGSRLMTEVREKRGLTYGIYSGFTAMQARGPFMINLQTRAELSENTLKLVQDILRDYLANGPTQKELDDAKRELSGSFPLSTASNSSIVAQLGAIGFYDLPLTFLEDFMQQAQSVTVEQIKTAMSKHLNADKLVIVAVGPTVAQKPLPPPTDRPADRPLGVPEH